MIEQLCIQDEEIARSVWQIQQTAYRAEAELMQFYDIPPLLETIEQLRESTETFYGWYNSSKELVGVVAVEMEAPRELRICRLMVRQDHYRQGIARSLMKSVLNESGIDRFIISTGERNEPALKLYLSLGFQTLHDVEIAPGVYLRTLDMKCNREDASE
ncbi:GNAT family N-acetyltransferase [Paenibacillus marinisediminis]